MKIKPFQNTVYIHTQKERGCGDCYFSIIYHFFLKKVNKQLFAHVKISINKYMENNKYVVFCQKAMLCLKVS